MSLFMCSPPAVVFVSSRAATLLLAESINKVRWWWGSCLCKAVCCDACNLSVVCHAAVCTCEVFLTCVYCLCDVCVSFCSLAMLQPWPSMGRCLRSDDQPSSLTFRVESMLSLWLPVDWWAEGLTSLSAGRCVCG